MQIGTVLVSLGSMGVLAGITLILSSKADVNTGSLIGLIGLAVCVGGYIKAQYDDQKELNRQRNQRNLGKDILSGIDDLNKNVSNLVDEIRQDRENKTRIK